VQNLITAVYPNLVTEYTDWLYLREQGILAPINDHINEINSIILSMIPRDVKTNMSCDTLFNSNDCGAFRDMEHPKLLHSLKIFGLPNHCLELKLDAPIVLLRNLNQLIGLCNDT